MLHSVVSEIGAGGSTGRQGLLVYEGGDSTSLRIGGKR